MSSAICFNLDKSKILSSGNGLKEFTGNNFNVATIVQFFFDWLGNILGKGENAGYQHSLLFLQYFQKLSHGL